MLTNGSKREYSYKKNLIYLATHDCFCANLTHIRLISYGTFRPEEILRLPSYESDDRMYVLFMQDEDYM